MTRGDQSLIAAIAGDVVSSVVPGAGPIVERMTAAVHAENARNRSMALAAACEVAGMSREDLAEEVAARPELVPLVTRLLFEAAMTGQHRKLEAMGVAFGRAVSTESDAETCELILSGLQNLVDADIAILRLLGELGGRVFLPHEGEESWEDVTEKLGWRLGLKRHRVAFGFVRLAGQGLVSQTGVISGERFTMTSTGRALTEALEALANDDAS